MEKIKEIISDYVDIPAEEISDNASLNTEIGLDSFGLISLITDIEDAFGIEIPESELKNFQTVSDLYSYIINNKNN